MGDGQLADILKFIAIMSQKVGSQRQDGWKFQARVFRGFGSRPSWRRDFLNRSWIWEFLSRIFVGQNNVLKAFVFVCSIVYILVRCIYISPLYIY